MQEEQFYNPIFVLLTTVLGCIMCWKLHTNEKLTQFQV